MNGTSTCQFGRGAVSTFFACLLREASAVATRASAEASASALISRVFLSGVFNGSLSRISIRRS